MKKIKVISCIITIAVMALIFFFSSQNSEQSSELSSGLTAKLIEFAGSILRLSEEKEAALTVNLHGLVRKMAHFTIYTAFGISAVIACKMNFIRKFSTAGFCTAAFAMLYAVSDELHQMFSDGRTPLLKDVLIDTAGVSTGVLIVYGIYRIYEKRRRK